MMDIPGLPLCGSDENVRLRCRFVAVFRAPGSMCYGATMAPRRPRSWAWVALVLALASAGSAAVAPLTPEETVRRYLGGLKAGNFDQVYDLVSKAMRQGKEKEVWVKEQKTSMSFADVKIFSFDVYPGKVEGDRAQVPNVLSSQDRFVNQ